jgi:glutamate 5-kinase
MHFYAMSKPEAFFEAVRTLVIKVGTRVLCDENNVLSEGQLAHLAAEISALQDQGFAPVLVTSGAVGVGMGVLGLTARPTELSEKQACAAIGQIRLMQRYADLFQAHGKTVAQILLSGEDFRDKPRFNNIRKTVATLLAKGVIPIVNENDTVATEEIQVGDNDKLSADVAQFLEADLLILLTDETGLFDKNPKAHADALPIRVVERVTAEILRLGDGPGSKVSVGGMRSKLNAIRQVTEAGTPALLARGWHARLTDLVRGRGAGTVFLPRPERIAGKRRWLAFVSKTHGRIVLDEGAVRALHSRPSSVLPVGVKTAKGSFKAGDLVELCASDGEVIGRGRTSYSLAEVLKIKGQKSARIPEILGRKGPGEVMHRDHLVLD